MKGGEGDTTKCVWALRIREHCRLRGTFTVKGTLKVTKSLHDGGAVQEDEYCMIKEALQSERGAQSSRVEGAVKDEEIPAV